jgi:polyphenol oxidase
VLRDPSLAAAVTVADCMPIWLLDRRSGAFGILHSGWRGTGILGVAMRAIARRFGSDPGSISVILGPAIGCCCYAVGEERAEAFAAEHGEGSVSRSGGRWRLDLRAANISIAERAGAGSLLSIEACTSCDPRLGSYRRQGPDSFTRMLAVCGAATVSPNLSISAGEAR